MQNLSSVQYSRSASILKAALDKQREAKNREETTIFTRKRQHSDVLVQEWLEKHNGNLSPRPVLSPKHVSTVKCRVPTVESICKNLFPASPKCKFLSPSTENGTSQESVKFFRGLKNAFGDLSGNNRTKQEHRGKSDKVLP
jgi:hypothetical protein